VRTARIYAGLFLALIALVGVFGVWNMPLWVEGQGVGPGAVPIAVSGMLGLFGVAVVGEAALARQNDPVQWPVGEAWVKLGAIILGLGLYALFTPWIGFTLTTVLVTGLTLKLISPYRPAAIAGLSLAFGLAFWAIFILVLGVSVPTGPLGF
jgi:putative tricarboxylic transport membrane protein